MKSNRYMLVPATALALAMLATPAAAASFAGYGFRMGAASAGIYGDAANAWNTGQRLGFSGSLFARYSLGRLLSIQPEFGWTSRGDQGDASIADLYAHYETRLDYVEIPVLLHVHIPTGTSFEPFFIAGPGVAFRTGASRTTEITGRTFYSSERVRLANIFENVGTFDNPNIRNVDWSAIAGGGLAYGRAPFRIVLDSRFALGLVGTYPDVEWSWAHNGAWVTTLGIELR